MRYTSRPKEPHAVRDTLDGKATLYMRYEMHTNKAHLQSKKMHKSTCDTLADRKSHTLYEIVTSHTANVSRPGRCTLDDT